MAYVSLQERLRGPIAEKLKKELNVTNVHALPKITRVTVNVGLNARKFANKEMQEFITDSLSKITGQRPSPRKSRLSVSNFNIRQNMVIGLAVTLRGKQMHQFLDRLLSYALPRVRDFQGLKTKFDGHGNYSIGLKDQSIFPELPAPDANRIFGMQIQVSTTAGTDEKGYILLKNVGFPFRAAKKDSASKK